MNDPAVSSSTNEGTSFARSARGRLTDRQSTILIVFGLAFWLAAALFIRLAPYGLWDGGVGTMMLFAFTVPVALLSVKVAKRVAGLAPDQVLPGVAIASAAAMLCDGIGLVWWSIYGESDRLPGAAWLLWGVGMILFAAFFHARRQGSSTAQS